MNDHVIVTIGMIRVTDRNNRPAGPAIPINYRQCSARDAIAPL
jgi:hypothetical protein